MTGRPRKTLEQWESQARRMPNGCWLVTPNNVARKIYEMRHGLLPKNIKVGHICNTPECIEDSHAWLGTNSELRQKNKSSHRKTLKQREEEAVRMPNGCWLHPRGDMARRIYIMRHGPITEKGIEVCHTCDTPACIEDSHHWLGTHHENMLDAAEKKRLVGRIGQSLSAEHKAKLSAIRKGKPFSPKHLAAVIAAHKGIPRSAETKAKLSAALKGRPRSPKYDKEIAIRRKFFKLMLGTNHVV